MPRHDQKAIKATEARDGTSHRSWGPALAHQLADDLFQRPAIERLDRTPAFGRGRRQLGQVPAVAFDGVRRKTPFYRKMRQIGVDEGTHVSQSLTVHVDRGNHGG
jgi:hypothetical protein